MNKDAKLRYDEGCLGAHALNAVGDRWAFLILRELTFAPKRFGQLRAGMPRITAAILSARLREMESAGIIAQGEDGYEMRRAGHAFLPVLQALCRFALLLPGHDPRRFISPSALMISMTSCILPEAPAGLEGGFVMGDESFLLTTGQGALGVRAGGAEGALFTLEGTANHLAAAVYGTAPIALLEREGFLRCTGDREAAQRFTSFFSLIPQDEHLQIGAR
ncbi:MAG: helix-turn-helix domain-containing protein [Paracoccus sp. (in: a-proteobacteria)]|nr:helix-turn-helix domain-containing protein [Paracoccus sp. (in: a-proteobacteria)]